MTKPSELFQSTGWYYARYRPSYPGVLFDHLFHSHHLATGQTVVDLGCGTGRIALPLARRGLKVIAVDPSAEMLDEARQLEAAELPRVGRKVRWVQGSAEDLAGLIEETVAAVIMGQSFHWMDRERVLEQCNKVIKPSGGVSLISGAGSIWTRPEPAWCVVVKEVIQEFLGTERRVGSGIYQEPKDRHEEMLGRSAFTNVARWSTTVSIERTLEQLIGLQYSTSYCAPRFFGDRKSEFEKTLERRLLALHANGIFVDQYEVKCLCATRYTGSAQ